MSFLDLSMRRGTQMWEQKERHQKTNSGINHFAVFNDTKFKLNLKDHRSKERPIEILNSILDLFQKLCSLSPT